MTTEQGSIYRPEQAVVPERGYQTRFGALTISGPPGSGTSVASEGLAALYKIDKPVFHAGEMMRENERARTGKEIIGGHARDVQEDVTLDEWIKDEILHSSIEGPVIVEAHLGGWVAKKTADEFSELLPPVFKVLLTASSQERARRIQQREAQKGLIISVEEIKRLTRGRERKNKEAWRKAHPELKGIDPHSKENVDEKGEPIYDLIVDTTKLSIEQVVERINAALLEQGLVQKS